MSTDDMSPFSEKYFCSLIENSSDVIVLLSIKGIILYSSPSAERVLGYTCDEILGRNGFELIHPDDLSNAMKSLKKILRKRGISVVMEMRLRHKNGSYISAEVTGTNLLHEKHINAIVINYRDVTERKLIEEKMARAAAIIASSDDAIISKTLEGIITSWNPAAEKIFGFSANEAVGQSIKIIIPHSLFKQEAEILSKLKMGETIEHFETVRQRKNGEKIFVSLSISPVKNQEGKVTGAAKIARDITEKKRFEERQKFLEKVSEVLGSSLDYKTTMKNIGRLIVPQLADVSRIILIDDGKLKEVSINTAYPNQVKLVKKLIRNYMNRYPGKMGIDKIINQGKSHWIHEFPVGMIESVKNNPELIQVFKELHIVSYMGVPMKVGSKRIGVITFVSTTPERKYTRDDLDFAEEIARRASYAVENAILFTNEKKSVTLRDNFISIASHELNTPLTSLKMFVQVLQRQLKETQNGENIHPFISRIDTQVDKLTILIKDLLNVSKIQAGKLDFYDNRIDLNNLILDVVQSVQSITNTHTILIEGHIVRKVWGDSDRISQVITNLLTNAIKYSPYASKVIVSLKEGKKTAIVSVKDFGIGIEKEQQKKIFQRFYRVSGYKEKTFPGLGLGLYVSHEIIKRHGGKMTVVSSKAKGSTFNFSLLYEKK